MDPRTQAGDRSENREVRGRSASRLARIEATENLASEFLRQDELLRPPALPCVPWQQLVVDFSEIQRRTTERSAAIPKDLKSFIED
jgi:hypothetical protein